MQASTPAAPTPRSATAMTARWRAVSPTRALGENLPNEVAPKRDRSTPSCGSRTDLVRIPIDDDRFAPNAGRYGPDQRMTGIDPKATITRANRRGRF